MFKQITFIMLFGIFSGQSLLAQHLLVAAVKDSTNVKFYNNQTGAFTNGHKEYIQYDSGYRETTSFTIYYDADGPTSYRKGELIYNPDNTMAEYYSFYTEEADTSGIWLNGWHFIDEYDTLGRTVYSFLQYGDSITWVNYLKQFYWYDTVEHRDTFLEQQWNDSLNIWENSNRELYVYLPDGKLKTYVYQDWLDNNWSDYKNETYKYRPDGKLLVHTTKYSDFQGITIDSFGYNQQGYIDTVFTMKSQTPFPSFLKLYFFDGQGKLSYKTGLRKNGNIWEYTSKEFFEQDGAPYSDDYTLDEMHFYQSGAFKPIWRVTKTFTPIDPGHFLYGYKNANLNSSGTEQVLNEWQYWYRLINTSGLLQPEAPKIADCAFANPLPDGSYVICNAPDAGAPLQISLADELGRTVQSLKVMPGEPFQPLPGLANGVYILSVYQNSTWQGVKRLILAR